VTSGATFNNQAGAVLDIRSDADIEYFGGLMPTITNLGQVLKSGGQDTSFIDVGLRFDNVGTVAVQSGTLSIRGTGASTGHIEVASGATLEISGNPSHSLGAGTTQGGAGMWRVPGGTVVIDDPVALMPASFQVSAGFVEANGDVTTFMLTLSGGAIGGDGQVTATSCLDWDGGTLQGNGVTSIPAGGTLTISGPRNKTRSGGTLEVEGVTTFGGAGPLVLSQGAELNVVPSGTFVVQTDAGFGFLSGAPATVNNAGTFINAGSAGVTTFAPGVSVVNTGSVQVQTGVLAFNGGFAQNGGNTQLLGGGISLNAGSLQVLAGTLGGSGVINGSGLMAGTLAAGLSPGALEFTANYEQTGDGVFNVEIGGVVPGVEYDVLVVGGQATLAGTINVSLIHGFSPQSGDSFEIMTFGSRAGGFANYTGLDVGGGVQLVPSFSATGLTLTAVQP